MNALKVVSDFAKPLISDNAFSMLIFFVTSRCNSVCRTCFYWDSLNQEGDLSFEEIQTISATMPRFRDLWLSGGEPTMREELVDIIDLFCKNNGVSTVRLPTNGLLTGRIENIVDSVFEQNPNITFHINLALDGYGETHDQIRGVPGNFEKALNTLRALTPRRDRYPGFRLFVNSVVCKENYEELIDLGHFIRDHFDVDGHYFQIIRGNAPDLDLKDVPMENLRVIYENAMKLHRHYLNKTREKPDGVPQKVFELFYLGTYLFTYETQFNNADHNELWKMPCLAGTTSAALDFDGKLRICELRDPVGNLRDYDCDFNKLWESKIMRDEVKQMHEDQCDCTHICFLYNSLKSSSRVKFWDIPKSYFKFKKSNERFNWLRVSRNERTPKVAESESAVVESLSS
ncbi:radical SAM protein [candidate division KSB1 bacterium]|nr:radical SAM protein [candidate division KSB1 bacterium]NIR72072.1 radical SAM protein [candidate division KSB1 bacterium]NIS26583.1 radical SAM protein [candidate division KSB1 bacterium]NIT73345.1 radical SAM protein [candidate division KSB1 bacterium]NIU27193.1 radical SAM protein [candidate division KSB1 bacterium]